MVHGLTPKLRSWCPRRRRPLRAGGRVAGEQRSARREVPDGDEALERGGAAVDVAAAVAGEAKAVVGERAA